MSQRHRFTVSQELLNQIRCQVRKQLLAFKPNSQTLVTAFCIGITLEEYAAAIGSRDYDHFLSALSIKKKELFVDKKYRLERKGIIVTKIVEAIHNHIKVEGELSEIRNFLRKFGVLKDAINTLRQNRDERWQQLVNEISNYPLLIMRRVPSNILSMLDLQIPIEERAQHILRMLEVQNQTHNLQSVGEQIDVYISSLLEYSSKEHKSLEHKLRWENPYIRWSFSHTSSSTPPIPKSTVLRIQECEFYILLLDNEISPTLEEECEVAREYNKPILTFVKHGRRSSRLKNFLRESEESNVFKTNFFWNNYDLTKQFKNIIWEGINKRYNDYWLAIGAGYLQRPGIEHLRKVYTREIVGHQLTPAKKRIYEQIRTDLVWRFIVSKQNRIEYNDLNEVIHDNRGIVLHGELETGKSSLLKNLVNNIAASIQWGSADSIPVYLSLEDYSPEKPIFNFIKEKLEISNWAPRGESQQAAYAHRSMARNLQTIIKKGQVLLILDNFDAFDRLNANTRTKAQRQIQALIGEALSSQCKVVLKSRDEFQTNLGKQMGLVDVHAVKIRSDDSIVKKKTQKLQFFSRKIKSSTNLLLQSFPETQRRYVNVCVVDYDTSIPLSKTTCLAVEKEYSIRIDIGALSTQSVTENAEMYPFPADLLPDTESGHWLEVIVASEDFLIPEIHKHIFLPKVGSSWTCECFQGRSHTCKKEERQPFLFFLIKPYKIQKNAQMRICIYYEKNLVQSQLLTAKIQEVEHDGVGYSSWIDYTLTSRFNNLEKLPPRSLNILTNRNVDGTHRIIINGRSETPTAFRLSEGQMTRSARSVRDAMVSFHYKEYKTLFSSNPKYDMLYDENNSKNKSDFIDDLKILAFNGSVLKTSLVGSDSNRLAQINKELQKPSIIQVSRIGGSEYVFPWAFIYDIPLFTDFSKYKICRLLDDWDNFSTYLDTSPSTCPHEKEHEDETVCPFGFWGFKHVIEQPPSTHLGRDLPLEISIANHPPNLLVGLCQNLDSDLTRTHLEKIQSRLKKFNVIEKDTKDKLSEKMEEQALELLYFYCHGKRFKMPGSNEIIPAIEVGDGQLITPHEITHWGASLWPKDHWKNTSPLVFINGCHTTELTPEMLVNFVDAFGGVNAAGIIGTEITLHQQVANEAAEEFLYKFQDGNTVGEAIRLMRLHFLKKGNLLGLAYTPYCSSSLKLSAH